MTNHHEEEKDWLDWILEKIKWFLSKPLGQFLSAIGVLILIMQLFGLWTPTIATALKLIVIIISIIIIFQGFSLYVTRKVSEFKIAIEDIKKIKRIDEDIKKLQEEIKQIKDKFDRLREILEI